MNKKVSIQGLKGSFHHAAALHLFGENLQLVECVTFKEVVSAVRQEQAHYAIIAIENSLAGSIIPNYNLVRTSGLEVCGEVGLRVHLNLLAVPGAKMKDIKEVQSHQMALLQCVSFFDQYPYIKRVEAFDTAGVAKEIAFKKSKNVAAIAGELAAKEYGLEILAKGIEDHEMNYTRFLALKNSQTPALSDEVSKISVYFETKHEPGALADLLSVIRALEINLSKLQSYPIPSKNNRYGFFVTLDIDHDSQISYLDIMLQAITLNHKILGKYKRGETYG